MIHEYNKIPVSTKTLDRFINTIGTPRNEMEKTALQIAEECKALRGMLSRFKVMARMHECKARATHGHDCGVCPQIDDFITKMVDENRKADTPIPLPPPDEEGDPCCDIKQVQSTTKQLLSLADKAGRASKDMADKKEDDDSEVYQRWLETHAPIAEAVILGHVSGSILPVGGLVNLEILGCSNPYCARVYELAGDDEATTRLVGHACANCGTPIRVRPLDITHKEQQVDVAANV